MKATEVSEVRMNLNMCLFFVDIVFTSAPLDMEREMAATTRARTLFSCGVKSDVDEGIGSSLLVTTEGGVAALVSETPPTPEGGAVSVPVRDTLLANLFW
jgi:hypothetical protein